VQGLLAVGLPVQGLLAVGLLAVGLPVQGLPVQGLPAVGLMVLGLWTRQKPVLLTENQIVCPMLPYSEVPNYTVVRLLFGNFYHVIHSLQDQQECESVKLPT
jgi:hypothetical protein